MPKFQEIMTERHFNSGKISAIILAAGRSIRMGEPKLLLKHKRGGTFIEYLIEKFNNFGCQEIIVVVNEEGKEMLKQSQLKANDAIQIIANPHPEWERFYSLKMGAEAMTMRAPAFVHNIDNPFINPETLNILSAKLDTADFISPVYKSKGGHPMLLSEKVIEAIRKEKQVQLHLKDFLSQFKRQKIEVDKKDILLNLNTKKEYEEWIRKNKS